MPRLSTSSSTAPLAEPEFAPALGPADRERVLSQLRLLRAARAALPQDPFPHYLAHLRFKHRGVSTDVLLTTGPRVRSAEAARAGIVIADWADSGFAEMFFARREGQHQSRSAGSRSIAGNVLERNVVGFHERELVEIVTPTGVLSRRKNGIWQRDALGPSGALQPRSPAAKRLTPSLIDVHLDPSQKSVVELPHGRSVLVLGEAGHGKTTVALHRLARLARGAEGPFRMVVLVPSLGLRGLLEPLLKSLRLNVEVRVYERWAIEQARRAFPELQRRRESQTATASVIRLKRDPALRLALDTLARRRMGPDVDDDPDRPMRTGAVWASRGDLLHLFGDRKLIEQVVRASREPVGAHGIAEILEHTRVQFSPPAEREYAHVDARRLRAVDGRPIDAGTPLEDAGSIDAEDCAVLFELDRLRAERRRKAATAPRLYDCIVLDEAQELAPLELGLIGRSLAPGGSLVVAGDADQQTDPAAFFGGWERSMAELGCTEYERVTLGVNYRCPPQVVQVARRLVSTAASTDVAPQPVSGAASLASVDAASTDATAPEAAFLRFVNESHLASWLIDELRQLERRDRRASVAVICRGPVMARRLTRVLRHAIDAKLVLDGGFVYRSGVNVTTVDQVKGLEFDYVIVPDASKTNYPNQPSSRRALYVAVTRARHQLVLGAVASRTDLLPEALPHPGAELQPEAPLLSE